MTKAESEIEQLADELSKSGTKVTTDQIMILQNELNAEKKEQTAATTPPDEQNVQLFERRKTHKRHNTHLEHVPTDETDLLIQTINEMDLGWKADTCKYQKTHSNYGAHCDQPLILAQTDSPSNPIGEVSFGEGVQF